MKYRRTFKIFGTQEEAQAFMDSGKGRKMTLTPWGSTDGTEHGFAVWYFE